MFCRRREELAPNFVGFSGKVGRERKRRRGCSGPMAVGEARWEWGGCRESPQQREKGACGMDSGQCFKVPEAGDFPVEATKHPTL